MTLHLPRLFAVLFAWLTLWQPGWAEAELVVIVSPLNEIERLTPEQIERLMLAKDWAFPNGVPALPLDLPRGAAREHFYQRLAGKSANQMAAYWSRQVFTGGGRPPREVRSEQHMLELVSQHTGYIGYLSRESLDNRVRVLLIIP